MPSLVICASGAAVGLSAEWLAIPRVVAQGAAQAILSIAHLFATLPGAVRTMPSAPAPALTVAFLGIVFACLWRGRLRWVAAPLCGAVLVWPRSEPPVAWIAADGDNAAVVEDGRVVTLKPKVRAFASSAWATRRGLAQPFDPDAEAELAFACDRSACIPKAGVEPALGAWWSRRVTAKPEALQALCQASDILVIRGPQGRPSACPSKLVLTDQDFARGGAAEIFRQGAGWRLSWAQDFRGDRPWSAQASSQVAPDRSPDPPLSGG